MNTDFGSCIAKKRNAQSYWMITSVASAFIQSKGTSQGAFFDTKDMSPLYNNDAFAEPGCLRVLVQYMVDHPDVVMATPRLLNIDGFEQHVGGTLDRRTGALRFCYC